MSRTYEESFYDGGKHKERMCKWPVASPTATVDSSLDFAMHVNACVHVCACLCVCVGMCMCVCTRMIMSMIASNNTLNIMYTSPSGNILDMHRCA